jgi:uncharacterized protein YndB with AHSA1/START domain
LKDKLEFDVFYPHPPERVWAALTEPQALSSWLLPTDFRPVVGERFQFEDPGRGARVEGRVLEAEFAKLLRFSWDDGEAGSLSVVTWTLEPKEGGTRVRLEHAAAVYAKPYVLIEANMNWHMALYASLPVLLQLLKYKQPTPIVYVAEESKPETDRRAGFRQDELVKA